MRTPTALLRIGAALGNQSAQKTLEGRRALKTPILTAIRNANREWKESREREGLRNPLYRPLPDRASLAGAATLTSSAARPPTPASLCIPTWLGNWRDLDPAGPAIAPAWTGLPGSAAPRTAPLPDNHSWLHHGSGGCSTLREFLDPRSDSRPANLFGETSPAHGGPAAFDIPRPATSGGLTVPAEDLPITIASREPAAAWDVRPESDCPDSDSDGEWDELTVEERREADRRFNKETQEIEAFEAMFNGSGPDASTPATDMPPPSSPDDMAHTLFTTPAQDDLMEEILAVLTQRYGHHASVRMLGDVVVDGGAEAGARVENPSQTTVAVPVVVDSAFHDASAVLSSRHKLSSDEDASDAASSSGDSGRGSDHVVADRKPGNAGA